MTKQLSVCRSAVLALMLVVAGCSVGGILRKLPGPFGDRAKDEAFRKQVEADPFPPARQIRK